MQSHTYLAARGALSLSLSLSQTNFNFLCTGGVIGTWWGWRAIKWSRESYWTWRAGAQSWQHESVRDSRRTFQESSDFWACTLAASLSTLCRSSGWDTIFRNNVAVEESVKLGLKQCVHDNQPLIHGTGRCIYFHLVSADAKGCDFLWCCPGTHTGGLQTFAPWDPLRLMATVAAKLPGPRVVLCLFPALEFPKNIAVWDVNE